MGCARGVREWEVDRRRPCMWEIEGEGRVRDVVASTSMNWGNWLVEWKKRDSGGALDCTVLPEVGAFLMCVGV